MFSFPLFFFVCIILVYMVAMRWVCVLCDDVDTGSCSSTFVRARTRDRLHRTPHIRVCMAVWLDDTAICCSLPSRRFMASQILLLVWITVWHAAIMPNTQIRFHTVAHENTENIINMHRHRWNGIGPQPRYCILIYLFSVVFIFLFLSFSLFHFLLLNKYYFAKSPWEIEWRNAFHRLSYDDAANSTLTGWLIRIILTTIIGRWTCNFIGLIPEISAKQRGIGYFNPCLAGCYLHLSTLLRFIHGPNDMTVYYSDRNKQQS